MKKNLKKLNGTAKELMAYGKENPMASDTAEGIAQWCIKKPLGDVLSALETLVQLGAWEKLRCDDRIMYRPARKKAV